MGAAAGDFDVQKYEIAKRIVISVNFFVLCTGIIKTYTRWGITDGVSTKYPGIHIMILSV
jgi:hypothetical protein